jgi:Tfp pilus assembly protein PilX
LTAAELRGEEGYTLVEVIVVLGLLVLVMGMLMSPIVVSQRIYTRDTNYAFAQQQAQTGLESMVSQIRAATSIISSGGYYVQMNVTIGGSALLVAYECDIDQTGTTYDECVRVQTTQGGTLPSMSTGKVVITNLQNSSGSSPVPVFTWGPDPNAPYYMTATIRLPASGGVAKPGLNHSLVFSDGTLMRNLNIAN